MKPICFYLPQFHPTTENNQWWGNGFTEWTNVAKARPRFKGHYQPHIPADLGFCDLRLEETRIAQAAMAKKFGIFGFCYYHYWFNGRLLLDRPLNEVLESGKPDFPFCLCWANEQWIRSWDNETQDVLVEQNYNDEEHQKHIEWLMKFFVDSRYIKINGKPVVLIYRVDELPNIQAKIESWRKYVISQKMPGLYLCAVKGYKNKLENQQLINLGFDAIVDFQPNNADFPRRKSANFFRYVVPRIINKIIHVLKLHRVPKIPVTDEYSYSEIVNNILKKSSDGVRVFPTSFPSWDNSPRKKINATVIQNNDAFLFQKLLENSILQVADYPEEERFIFINAWNEWAEGCHLEPDVKNGEKFLEAVAKALGINDAKRI